MTTTADWLHLRLGTPLPDYAETDSGMDGSAEINEGEIIARQRARAAQPLSVTFPGR